MVIILNVEPMKISQVKKYWPVPEGKKRKSLEHGSGFPR
jgi:hypothetical protein